MPRAGGITLESAQPGKARILLVDDDPNSQEMCREALARAGHEVTVVGSGTAALSAMERTDYDAGVLDIVLPDSDGLTLLSAMRERNEDAVVVLITGFASLETAMEAVRLGAYDYLRKPFHSGDLVRTVERGLEGQRLRERNRELLQELRQANRELVQQRDQLHDRMRLATNELTAFVELGKRLSEEHGPLETLNSIMQAGQQLTQARAAAVYMVDAPAGRLRGLFGVGLSQPDVADARILLGEGVLGEVGATGVARIENDLLAGPVADDDYLGFLGVQSVLAAPLICEDKTRGVLAFFDREAGDFSEDSLNLVGVLAGQAARVVVLVEEHRQRRPPDDAEDEFVDLVDLF